MIDERFNSGGQIPDRFVELLNRPVTNYWAVRDGKDWQWPPASVPGPKVMLINGWSGSGGDCFPLYFRQLERSGALDDVDVELEATTENIVAKQPVFASLLDCPMQALDRQRVLGANVNDALGGTHRVAADQHALEQ